MQTSTLLAGKWQCLDRLVRSSTSFLVLNLFQIIKCFGFCTYIDFTMYLDIVYIYVHSKYNVSRKAKTIIIWNGGSSIQVQVIQSPGNGREFPPQQCCGGWIQTTYFLPSTCNKAAPDMCTRRTKQRSANTTFRWIHTQFTSWCILRGKESSRSSSFVDEDGISAKWQCRAQRRLLCHISAMSHGHDIGTSRVSPKPYDTELCYLIRV